MNNALKISEIRDRVLTKMFVVSAIFLNLAYLSSLIRIFQTGWLDIFTLHTVFFLGFNVAFLYRKKISPVYKAHIFVNLFLVISISAMYFFAFSGGVMYFVLSIGVAAIMLGKREAILYSAFFMGTVLIFAYLYTSGIHTLSVDLNEFFTKPLVWQSLFFGTSLMVAILTIGFSSFNQELIHLVRNTNKRNEELEGLTQELTKTINSKNNLFLELHHRIKNNMNLIQSMMYLQEKSAADLPLSEFLFQMNGRIKAISQIHEELLSLEQFDVLYCKNYLTHITAYAAMKYPNTEYLDIALKIANHPMHIDKMLSLGILVNELLSVILVRSSKKLGKTLLVIQLQKRKKRFHLSLDSNTAILELVSSDRQLSEQFIALMIESLRGKLHSDQTAFHMKISFPE